MPGICAACRQARMVLDPIHGVLACDSCGTVGNQAETELRSEFQTGHLLERRGTYVGESDTGVAAAKGLMRGHISSHSFFTESSRYTERHRVR
jgi:transcription initiation factor TFIIIB Brf1 subunit/transcription initiation factor TFIIB